MTEKSYSQHVAIVRAELAGFVQGSSLSGFAGSCPHCHYMAALRKAWMDGFSRGRATIEIAAIQSAESARRIVR